MMPSGRMNERNMRLAMRKMGMTTENLDDVQEVIIRRAKEEIVIEHAEVTMVTVQGMKTFQVMGEVRTRPVGTASAAPKVAAPPAGPPEEDIELVMSQSGADRPSAIAALKESHGEPAEAILKLLAKKKG